VLGPAPSPNPRRPWPGAFTFGATMRGFFIAAVAFFRGMVVAGGGGGQGERGRGGGGQGEGGEAVARGVLWA
jgi:hypothetical protein